MTIAIEITRFHDLDADHEVGGQDLPIEYTAMVRGGTVIEALDLMIAGCAFSGRRFEWTDSLEKEKLKIAIDGKVFHYIQRRHQIALMTAFRPRASYLCGFWWESIPSNMDVPQIFDRGGRHVQPGQYCRFERRVGDRHIVGTGWVWKIDAHRERPIAVWQDSEPEASHVLGLMPSEIEVLDDDAEMRAIEAILNVGILSREPRDWIEESLAKLPKDGHPSMHPDDRERWAAQYPLLQAQYDSFEQLIRSYGTPRVETIFELEKEYEDGK